MPQRSRKLLFFYCADPRGNKSVVQSHPAKLCWGTRCWALQPFFWCSSHQMKSSWKHRVFLHMCLQSSQPSRARSQLGSKQQWQFCTGQVLHFSGKMQVTGGCSGRRTRVQYCHSVGRCSGVCKSVPLWYSRGTRKYEFLLKTNEYLLVNLKPGHIFPEMQAKGESSGQDPALPQQGHSSSCVFLCLCLFHWAVTSSDQTCTADRQTPPAW